MRFNDEVVEASAHRYDGGVMFKMRRGVGDVVVLVSDEALDDRDRSRGPGRDRLAIFERHRDAIVIAAGRSLDRHMREKDGTVLIRTMDLNG